MRSLAAVSLCLSLVLVAFPSVAQQREQTPQRVSPKGPSGLVAKSADLVPIASRITNGAVSVRNAGSAASGPSVATVVCQKLGGGSCADSPALKQFEDPAYPNAVVVKIPAIQAGHTYSYTLPFWKSLKWQPGTYQFTVTADAGKQVAESNEGNNVGTAQMKK